MSFNFPLVLFIGTLVCGVVWLIDIFLLRPKRRRVVEQASKASEDERALLLKEPLFVEYAISFFPVLALVFVLRSFIAEPFQIPTGSMIPTLLVGDFVVVNKFAYGIRLPVLGTKIFDVDEPKNGDVMVFIPPHVDEYFIKRVVGVPGDTIRYEDKKLYINGVLQPQKFVAELPPNQPTYRVLEEKLGNATHLIYNNMYRDNSVREWVIPEGHYFMMGDNRDRSSDSRYWGYASEENIIGKAFAVWLHKDPGLHLPNFSHNGWIE